MRRREMRKGISLLYFKRKGISRKNRSRAAERFVEQQCQQHALCESQQQQSEQ